MNRAVRMPDPVMSVDVVVPGSGSSTLAKAPPLQGPVNGHRTRTPNSDCDFARLAGSWSMDGVDWVVPGCSFNTTPTSASNKWNSSRSRQQHLYDVAEKFTVNRKETLQHTFWNHEWWPLPSLLKAQGAHGRGRPTVLKMCLLGDSNFRVGMASFLYAVDHFNTHHDDVNIQFKYHENFLHDVCSDKFVPSSKGDPNFFGKLKECLDAADVVVVSFASHAPGRSMEEMQDAVANLTHVVNGGAPDMSGPSQPPRKSARPCVLVVSTLDFKFEAVPSKFAVEQAYFRSTFRQGFKNELVRDLLEGPSATPGVHYVDLFSASAALHYDGHPYADPVHFFNFMHIYEVYADIILAASGRLCNVL